MFITQRSIVRLGYRCIFIKKRILSKTKDVLIIIFFLKKYMQRMRGLSHKIWETNQSMTKFLHYTRRTLHKGLIHLRINKGNISLNPGLAPFIVIQPFDLQTECQLSRRRQYKRPIRRNRSDPTTSLPFSTFPKKSQHFSLTTQCKAQWDKRFAKRSCFFLWNSPNL